MVVRVEGLRQARTWENTCRVCMSYRGRSCPAVGRGLATPYRYCQTVQNSWGHLCLSVPPEKSGSPFYPNGGGPSSLHKISHHRNNPNPQYIRDTYLSSTMNPWRMVAGSNPAHVQRLSFRLARRSFCESTTKNGSTTEKDNKKEALPPDAPTANNTADADAANRTTSTAAGGGPGSLSERGEETRGALKNYMTAQKEGLKGESLWAKLRRDNNPAFSPSSRPRQNMQSPPPSASSSGDVEMDNTGTNKEDDAPRRSWSSPKHPQTMRPPTPDANMSDRREASTDGQSSQARVERPRSGPPGDGRPKRSFNPRARQQFAPRAASGEESSAPGGLGGGGGRKGKRRGAGGEGDGGGGRFGDAMPPAVKAMLSDEAFQEAVEKGYSIDTRGLDGIDAFFADVYLASLKTPDARMRTVVESTAWRRTQLPKARPVHQLIASTRPLITGAKEGSEGHRVASQAWQAVSRNYYVSEPDKAFICDQIAKKRDEIQLAIEATEEVDMIFQSHFRKGFMGIEDEKRRLMISQNEEAMRASGYNFDSAEDTTEWDVEAVVDEDEL